MSWELSICLFVTFVASLTGFNLSFLWSLQKFEQQYPIWAEQSKTLPQNVTAWTVSLPHVHFRKSLPAESRLWPCDDDVGNDHNDQWKMLGIILRMARYDLGENKKM